MSAQTRWIVSILGALAVIAVIAVVAFTLQRGEEAQPSTPGKWPAGERTAFINSCVDKCRAAPGVTPDRYPLCDQACKCGADEAEKIVSAQELVDIYRALSGGKSSEGQNDKLEKIKAAGIACAKNTPR